MAKQPNWNQEELNSLDFYYRKGKKAKEIASILGRSKNGVACKIFKIYNGTHFCVDCFCKIKNCKGNKLRCDNCERIEKKNRYKRDYLINNATYKARKDRLRFGNNREMAIKRDGEKCLICGMTRKEHKINFGCDITVDHIDGTGRNNKKTNNNLDNLQTLCLICHGKKDAKRRVKDWSMCAESLKKYWKKKKTIAT